jgi:6-pyruvoyltetrahydropterin/6-carboxytetrahydropterin synthase
MKVTISRKALLIDCIVRTGHSRKTMLFFGKCNNPNYHGHNYELIVGVTGHIDPETGYVMDVKILSDLIKEEVENRFDHKI